jgi:hypothetical protein
MDRAMREFARVLGPNALGSAITNGPEDKLRFKGFMAAANKAFGKEATTVSSSVDYYALIEAISAQFPYVKVMVYRDDMMVDTPKRQTYYMTSWNSYRRAYDVSTAEWMAFTRENVEGMVQSGEFEDTIDIATVFFSHSADALSHIEDGRFFKL